MTKNYFFKLSLLIVSTVLSFSCAQNTDKNKLQETQLCLNDSPPSQARACIEKISSDQSPLAYKLRCAAVFISEGFNTPSSFITALDKLNGTSGGCTGGCSSTVGTISALAFKNTDNTSSTDRARSNSIADEAFRYCNLADAKIYAQISTLFKLGTYAANTSYLITGLGTTPTEDQIKTALADPSFLSDADMGAIVETSYASSCTDTTNASDSTKKYCAEMSAAMNSGSTQAAKGACLKGKLANPNYVCP